MPTHAERTSPSASRSEAPKFSPTAPVPRGVWVLVVVFFACYLGCVGWYVSPHAAGADAAGYLSSAKLMTEGKLSGSLRIPPWAEGAFSLDFFTPLGLKLDPARTGLVPMYPVGQPLQLAFFGKLFGLDLGPNVMNVLAMLGVLLLLRAIALQLGVRPRWAVAMTVVYALSPLVFSYALQVMSELTSTLWVLAAIYGGLRSREKSGWAALSGFAFAMAVLVRPANAIAAIPVVLALGFSWRRLVMFGLAGLPAAVFLGWYNRQLYGSAFVTGYGDVESLFLVRYLAPSLLQYAIWLPVHLTPLVLAGLAVPFIQQPKRTRLVVSAWVGTFLIFYAFYYHTHETWWTLRFLVPAFPAIAIAATLVLQEKDRPWFTWAFAGPNPERAPSAWRRMTLTVVAVMLPLAIGWQFAWNRHFKCQEHEVADRVFKSMSAWVDEKLPIDAVFTCGVLAGAFYYYSEKPFFYYEQFDAKSYATFNQLAAENRLTVYAGVMDHEEPRAFQLMPGSWERVAQIRYGAIWKRVGL